MKRVLVTILTCAMVFSALGTTVFAAIERPRSVAITGSKSVGIDKTIQLDFTVRPDDYDVDYDWEWDSSDYDIAEVDDNGEVYGVDNGVATIRLRLYAEDPDRNDKKTQIASASVDIRVGRGESSNAQDDTTSSSRTTTTTTPSTTTTTTAPTTAPSTTTTSTSTNAIRSNGVIPSATVTNAVQGALVRGATKSTIFKNYDSVSASTLQAANTAMSGGTVLLSFDTSGTTYEGRLTINPSNATKLTNNINVQVYTSSSRVSSVKNVFTKYFNNNVVVVRAAHSGSYGMTVNIAAKVGTALANSKDLRLYSYNITTGTYLEIKNANIRIDANGYAHFSTTSGDYLVISDGPLVRK